MAKDAPVYVNNKGRPRRGAPDAPPCPFCKLPHKDLPRHISHCHRDECPEVCKVCGDRFMNHKSLQVHMGFRHPSDIERRRNDPVLQRDWMLRKKYGITLADYEALLESQGGGCAGCGARAADSRRGNLHVDHDHETLRVRGVLCGNCNQLLGKAKDDPMLLRRLARYLES